jgi:hypothetical protein
MARPGASLRPHLAATPVLPARTGRCRARTTQSHQSFGIIFLYFSEHLVVSLLPPTALPDHNWNALLWPLIVSTNSSMYTLSSGLALFLGQHVIQYGLIMAGSVLAIMPMVVAFLIIQRRFTESIATSGLR